MLMEAETTRVKSPMGTRIIMMLGKKTFSDLSYLFIYFPR